VATSKPVSEIIDFVKSNPHFIITHPFQFIFSFHLFINVFEYVEGIYDAKHSVSEWEMLYIAQYEVWNLGVWFLDVTIDLALQITKSVFVSAASCVKSQFRLQLGGS